MTEVLPIIAMVIAIVVTIVYVWLAVSGVRTLKDIRDVLRSRGDK